MYYQKQSYRESRAWVLLARAAQWAVVLTVSVAWAWCFWYPI